MAISKVEVIKVWLAHMKVIELRYFLGLANYYRRFIKSYSKVVAPLTNLLKKETRWDWELDC